MCDAFSCVCTSATACGGCAMIDRGLFEGLEAIVGASYVLTSAEAMAGHLRDWSGDHVSQPLCVVRPGSTQEVSAVLAFAAARRLGVVPQGGNTGLVAGTFTTGGRDILLNLARLRQIRCVRPADMVMHVEAGVTVEEAQNAADAAGCLFPLSFGAQGSAQIGGAIAVNAGGLNVLRYGMTRNLVIGLEVALSDGTVLDMMSLLHKDNRGLALQQLFIGSEGALGVITAASLRLVPKITRHKTALLAFSGLEEIVDFSSSARAHCSDLMSAFEFMPDLAINLATKHVSALSAPLEARYPYYALVELSASGPVDLETLLMTLLEEAMEGGHVVDGVIAASEAQRSDLWLIRDAMVEAQAARGRHLRTDLSVPLSQVANLVSALEAWAKDGLQGWTTLAYGHLGDGNVHFNGLPPLDMDAGRIAETISRARHGIHDTVRKFGGSLSAEHGIGRDRLAAHYSDRSGDLLGLAESIKNLLDASGRMNPGCLFPTDAVKKGSDK